MKNQNSEPLSVRISDELEGISSVGFDAESDEILIVGYEGLAVLTTSGNTVATSPLPPNSKIIGYDRAACGWRVLMQEDTELQIRAVSDSGTTKTVLQGLIAEPHTARWSRCGTHVAVGSLGTTLSVWMTDTGKLHWEQSIAQPAPLRASIRAPKSESVHRCAFPRAPECRTCSRHRSSHRRKDHTRARSARKSWVRSARTNSRRCTGATDR